MRICYVNHAAVIRGGAERGLVELVRQIRSSTRHEISVMCPDGPLVEDLAGIDGVRRIAVPMRVLWRTANPLLLGRFAMEFAMGVAVLRARLRDERPDVVHAHAMTAALYAGLALKGSDIPMIWHMHDLPPRNPVFRTLLPRLADWSDRIIAVSQAVKKNLTEFGVDPTKIIVVENGVAPLHLHGGSEFRARWGIGDESFLIGVVGQLVERKGQLGAVDAFARLLQELPTARLVLCGAGLEESEYGRSVGAAIRELDLDERVIVTGFLRDPASVFDAIDVLLVPSTQEPFGRVVVEAMHAGKPVVATNVGGIPELIRDGLDGLLVDPDDSEAMAAAVVAMALEPARARSMADRARARAEELFSWQGRGRQVDQLYSAVAGE